MTSGKIKKSACTNKSVCRLFSADETLRLFFGNLSVKRQRALIRFHLKGFMMTAEMKLLCSLQAREEQALEQAIRTYTPYLSTVIFRAAGNSLSKEDTEEIVSDVFLSLWRNPERIDLQKGTLRAYLAGAARNQICKRLRVWKPELSLEDLGVDTLEAIPAPSSDSLLWDTVAELGEEDAEIFVRFYRYGESLREIAGAMDLKVPTIKTRLSRGKKKLKKILTDAEVL